MKQLHVVITIHAFYFILKYNTDFMAKFMTLVAYY